MSEGKYILRRRVTDWRGIISTVLFFCFALLFANCFVLAYLFGGEPKDVTLLFMQIGMLNAMIVAIILICPDGERGSCTKIVEEEVYLEKVKQK